MSYTPHPIQAEQRLQRVVDDLRQVIVDTRYEVKKCNENLLEIANLEREIAEKTECIEVLKENTIIAMENIENLKGIIERDNITIIKSKQSIKKLSKREKNIPDKTTISLSQSDKYVRYKKQLKLEIIKLCTNTHIDTKDADNNIIKGFSFVENIGAPFEIDRTEKTDEEIADILWNNTGKTSQHAEAWDKLFE